MGVGKIEVTRLWRSACRCSSDPFPEEHPVVLPAPRSVIHLSQYLHRITGGKHAS